MKNNPNKHIDQHIKKAFDQIDRKAPEGVWDNIKEDLKKDAVDQSIDQKIQESYSASNTIKAPLMIWNNIDQQLDRPIGEEDALMDGKINSSYRSQEDTAAPNSVWNAVNKQLNIDRSWNKIAQVLEQQPIVSDWRKKMFHFFAAASVLFFLVKNCIHQTGPNPLELSQEVALHSNEAKNKAPKSVGIISSTSEFPALKSLSSGQDWAKQSTPQKNEWVDIAVEEQQYKKPKQLSNDIPLVVQSTPQQNPSVDFIAVEETPLNHSSASNQLSPKQTSTQNIVEANLLDSSSSFISNTVVANTLLQQDALVKDININTNQSDESSVTMAASAQPPLAYLSIIERNLFNLSDPTEPIQVLEAPSLSNIPPIAAKVQAGAFIVLNATMLLNNDTRSGFDASSLVQNYYGMAANYGVWISCKIKAKSALIAEFSINADNRQAYGVYERGNYYIKEWVMKYNRLSLAYQHEFWSTRKYGKIQSKLLGQAGLYAGFLREAKLFYDGDLKFDGSQEHHRLDFGFKLAFGQEIYMDRFVFGYGLRFDFGVVNIFKGNTNSNPNDNNTNIIHLGGYLSIGYRF